MAFQSNMETKEKSYSFIGNKEARIPKKETLGSQSIFELTFLSKVFCEFL